jgi:hypothetical protein
MKRSVIRVEMLEKRRVELISDLHVDISGDVFAHFLRIFKYVNADDSFRVVKILPKGSKGVSIVRAQFQISEILDMPEGLEMAMVVISVVMTAGILI